VDYKYPSYQAFIVIRDFNQNTFKNKWGELGEFNNRNEEMRKSNVRK
jgi:hypothetical protein